MCSATRDRFGGPGGTAPTLTMRGLPTIFAAEQGRWTGARISLRQPRGLFENDWIETSPADTGNAVGGGSSLSAHFLAAVRDGPLL